MLGGGGVDGAIHRQGGSQILEDCKAIRARQGKCKTGEAVITRAGNLPAMHVIHTVGPVYSEHKHEQHEALLSNCYKNAISLLFKHKLRTIAFPNISTGIYVYAKKIAAKTAINTIQQLDNDIKPIKIVFVCYDDENYQIYKELLNEK